MGKNLWITISVVLVIATFGIASAEEFPSRDINLVVPFDPGGSVDTTSRIIAESANTLLKGVRLNVVNRSGGGGVVGQTYVSKAKPNGYTVLAMTSSVVTNPQLKGAKYSIDEFVPVGLYNLDPEVIVVPASSKYFTIKDFMEATSKKPMNMVVAGIATSHHMSGVALEMSANAKFNYVPTGGFGKQLQAVLGGHADGGLWPMGEASNHAKTGGVRLLAVASDARDINFPDVPTFDEAGLGIEIWATFRGWAVPKGTPDAVVTKLSNLLKQVNELTAYKNKMLKTGYKPVFRDAAGFKKVIDNYASLTSVIIKEKGLGKKK